MLAMIHSYLLSGIDAILCEVEVDVSHAGFRKQSSSGWRRRPSRNRSSVFAGRCSTAGFPFPAHALLINLAPADVKKEAPTLDLPIAIGMLRGTTRSRPIAIKSFSSPGNWPLTAGCGKSKAALSLACWRKQKQMHGVILPQENAREAAVVEGIEVYPVHTLAQAVAFLNEQLPLEPYELDGQPYQQSQLSTDAWISPTCAGRRR